MSLKKIASVLSTSDSFKSIRAWHSVLDKSSPKALHLKGFAGSVSSFAIADVVSQGRGPICCVVPDEDASAYLRSDLQQILGEEESVLWFPASHHAPYDPELADDPNRLTERAEVLQVLSTSFQGVVVTSARALAEKVPSPDEVMNRTLLLETGDNTGPDFLFEYFGDQGFTIVNFVNEPGEMARRGGILDLYPYVGDYPVRLEFFGDELDSIREFDPVSQRSISRLNQVRLVPNLELSNSGVETKRLLFTDFLPDDTLLVVSDNQAVEQEVSLVFETASDDFVEFVRDHPDSPDDSIPSPTSLYASPSDYSNVLKKHSAIHYGSFTGILQGARVVRMDAVPQTDFNSRIPLLRQHLLDSGKNNIQVFIACDSAGQEVRLRELLNEDIEAGYCQLFVDPIHSGFDIQSLGLSVLTDHQIFNRYHRPTVRKAKKRYGGLSLRELRHLSFGDFVTHIDYGIGRFAGLHLVTVREVQQEAVKLLFRDEDVLYVNVNSLHKLHKFTGKEGHQPRLTKLGTGEWDRVKSRTKRKVKDIARELIKLYAQRRASEGFSFSPDSVWQNELEASFEFEDTPDQAQAVADVKADMELDIPMDRLVCGDVGFGKTEVAVRAAFKAVQDGKQVAILVPTTILAAQHFETFTRRLASFPVKIDVLSRFRTPLEQKDILARLEEGSLDIVIGTNRLAARKVKIKNLGLLIIDEEQRFGVKVKERLRELRAHVDTLTLTATPIPRTLQFSLMGARDLSIINTPPPNRQPIETQIHTYDKNLIRDAIVYEIGRGGQVFYIHNRVRTIQETADMIRLLVPDVRVRFGHGQMSPTELEDVMMAFINKKFDVLVSTNIVESGLDISNANTMIIDRAERFGLAELHQLRGRVGRSGRKAFCYLLTPSLHTLTREAKQRLQAVEEFSDLGAGFNLAMRDLDIRGAGNLLGGEQSGFIGDVGFETYHRILDEAVQELKADEFSTVFDDQGPPPAKTDTSVDVDVNALIPEDYVSDRLERLNLYRTLSEARNLEIVGQLREEWRDRFGELPIAASNLLFSMSLKLRSVPLRLPKIQFKNQRLFLTMPDAEDTYFFENYFRNLLEHLANVDRRYVLKEYKGKLRVIIQDVPDLFMADQIIGVATEAVLLAVESS